MSFSTGKSPRTSPSYVDPRRRTMQSGSASSPLLRQATMSPSALSKEIEFGGNSELGDDLELLRGTRSPRSSVALASRFFATQSDTGKPGVSAASADQDLDCFTTTTSSESISPYDTYTSPIASAAAALYKSNSSSIGSGGGGSGSQRSSRSEKSSPLHTPLISRKTIK
jgi:hypothetical protein